MTLRTFYAGLSWFALGSCGAFVASCSLDLGRPAAGTGGNFGPDLQTAAAGVCRQPEGLTIDPDGNLYAASNSDTATTFGHICVIDKHGSLVDIITVPAAARRRRGSVCGANCGERLALRSRPSDNIQPHGRNTQDRSATHQVKIPSLTLAFPQWQTEDRPGTST